MIPQANKPKSDERRTKKQFLRDSGILCPYRRRAFSRGMETCLTVQRVLCTSSQLAQTCKESFARSHPSANRAEVLCMNKGAGLAVQKVFCTSSQLALACIESLARSSSREMQSIDILVPKICYHVPHPSHDQNMTKTTPFR